MIGYQKTTSTGTDDCIVIEPRACYRRPAPITADWTKVLIGAFVSLIGTTDENTDCAAETIPYSNFRDQLSFGLASGAGAPGIAGHRFVGMGRPATGTWTAPYYDAANTAWQIVGNSQPVNSCIADGTTITLGGGNAYITSKHRAPSGTTLFAAFIGVEITLTLTGATMRFAPTTSTPYGETVVTEGALLQKMFTASYATQTALTGGWWGGGGGSGCTDFFIRFPHYANRLRLHAVRVEQLA